MPPYSFPRLVERPGKKQIVVPLGAVLAAKRPQKQKWKNQELDEPAAMRTSNVEAPAIRAASQQKHSIVGHGHKSICIVTCVPTEVNPGRMACIFRPGAGVCPHAPRIETLIPSPRPGG
jgi:hypothetical protein